MERLSDEFFEAVRRGYLKIAEAEPERVKIVDASGTEDQVEEAIWKEIHGLLFEQASRYLSEAKAQGRLAHSFRFRTRREREKAIGGRILPNC